MGFSFVGPAGPDTSCNEAIWHLEKARQVSSLRYETNPEGHVVKRKTDWEEDKPVISENARGRNSRTHICHNTL